MLNASTLSYWVPGGNHGPWFVPSIIFMYLAFPLFYRIINAIRMRGVVALTFVGLFFSFYFGSNVGWYYDCLIARLPIFCLGIVLYRVAEGYEEISSLEVLGWVVVLILSLSYNTTRFFRTTMACPLFILAVLPALRMPALRKMLEFIGLHSFELFLGSELGFRIARYLGLWKMCRGGLDIALFLIVNMAGFAVFYYTNKVLKKFGI